MLTYDASSFLSFLSSLLLSTSFLFPLSRLPSTPIYPPPPRPSYPLPFFSSFLCPSPCLFPSSPLRFPVLPPAPCPTITLPSAPLPSTLHSTPHHNFVVPSPPPLNASPLSSRFALLFPLLCSSLCSILYSLAFVSALLSALLSLFCYLLCSPFFLLYATLLSALSSSLLSFPFFCSSVCSISLWSPLTVLHPPHDHPPLPPLSSSSPPSSSSSNLLPSTPIFLLLCPSLYSSQLPSPPLASHPLPPLHSPLRTTP